MLESSPGAELRGCVEGCREEKQSRNTSVYSPKKSIPRMRKLFPLRGKVPAGGNCKAERLCTEVLCKHNLGTDPFRFLFPHYGSFSLPSCKEFPVGKIFSTGNVLLYFVLFFSRSA